jgi:hypothetical protein
MKYLIPFFASILLIMSAVTIVRTENRTATIPESADVKTKTSLDYPIAPGVWYPGDGALPKNPVRYYWNRVKQWDRHD